METQNLQLEKSILSKKGNSGKVVVPAFKLNDTTSCQHEVDLEADLQISGVE